MVHVIQPRLLLRGHNANLKDIDPSHPAICQKQKSAADLTKRASFPDSIRSPKGTTTKKMLQILVFSLLGGLIMGGFGWLPATKFMIDISSTTWSPFLRDLFLMDYFYCNTNRVEKHVLSTVSFFGAKIQLMKKWRSINIIDHHIAASACHIASCWCHTSSCLPILSTETGHHIHIKTFLLARESPCTVHHHMPSWYQAIGSITAMMHCLFLFSYQQNLNIKKDSCETSASHKPWPTL